MWVCIRRSKVQVCAGDGNKPSPFFENDGYGKKTGKYAEYFLYKSCEAWITARGCRKANMKKLYLIGGPMGVGKTAACRELKRMLPNSVFLDGDWCWDANPFQVTEETKAMVMDNICHLLGNFLRCTAYTHVIFCWVMHEQSIVDEILRRLPLMGCEVKAVSLLADAQTLRARLAEDVRQGARRADVIERSLARLPLYSRLNTLKIDTTGKSPLDVAAEIAAL